MIRLTQFSTQTSKGVNIFGEYEGNELFDQVVVFSHGFGLQRDNRGKFIELSEVLKEKYIVVRFDYNEILADGSLLVPKLDKQVEKLKKVLVFVRKVFPDAKVNVVAHSLGCVILGYLNPDNIKKVILSAPPVKASGQDFNKNFSYRFEATNKYGADIKIRRSDGSFTYLKEGFVTSLEKNKPYESYINLSLKCNLSAIIATNDSQLDYKDYSQMLSEKPFNIIRIKADHDFGGIARKKWIKAVKDLLKL